MARRDRHEIVKGEDTILIVQILDENEDPVSLAGFTDATAFFSGGVEATGSVVSSDLGKLSFPISDTDTADLVAGDEESFEVEINQGTTKTIVLFEKMLIVKERIWGS